MPIRKVVLKVVPLAALFAAFTVVASAESFSWNFASPNVSGQGTLIATAYGSPGEYLITAGSGTVTDSALGTMAITFAICSTPGGTCVFQNSDGGGANITYDNLLFTNNAPGSELTDNGVVLSPGFANTAGIEVYDSPSQEFYSYNGNGYQNLTTPFNVTLLASPAATPEPSGIALLGTGLLGLAAVARKRLSASSAVQ